MTSIFSPEALDKAIKDAIPAGLEQTNAIVLGTNLQGIRVAGHAVFDAKRGTFILEGAYEHAWTGEDSVGGRVIYTWGGGK